MTVLHKQVYGQGDPVIMLHGWAMHTGVWRDFALQMAEQCQVICVDLPGHGLSSSVSPYTLDSVVDAIVKELPGQACAVIGWSLGGNIALRLAEKYPERINSLILIASNPRFIKTESWPGMDPQVLKQFASHLQDNSAQTLLRFMSLQVHGHPDAKSILKKIQVATQDCATPAYEVLMAGLSVLQAVDQLKTLSSLKIPVQMILGEQDRLVPVSVGEQCRMLLPELELHQIAGAGHVPFIAEQQQVLDRVREFMVKNSVCTGHYL